MNKELDIHEVTNGVGETVGWAVIRNKSKKVAEFATVEEAVSFADAPKQPAPKTETISPIDLNVGDRVLTWGAVVEVAHIVNAGESEIEGGVRIAACISRLVGDNLGAIPRAWFETPEEMTRRGCKWANALPEGLYWNVQGNAHARCSRILAD